MLFLSLALATACSKGPDKDPEKKENKGSVNVGTVLQEARTAKGEIDGFVTTKSPHDSPAGVRGCACVALLRVEKKLAGSLSVASEGNVKAKLGEATSAIGVYLGATLKANAVEELKEAKQVADRVVNALTEAEKAHTS